MEDVIHSKPIDYLRIFNTMAQNVVTALLNAMPREFFNNKVENFLTCLHLTSYLKGKIFDDNGAKIFEEMSLMALYKSLFAEGQIADVELLLKEMPYILTKPYPVVKEISKTLIDMLPQIMLVFRMQNAWQQFTNLEHEIEMLKNFNDVMDK